MAEKKNTNKDYAVVHPCYRCGLISNKTFEIFQRSTKEYVRLCGNCVDALQIPINKD